MAVDLRNNSLFQRASILLEPDCLIKLDHASTKDRIRKLMFDRVDQVIVWRRMPAVRMLIVGLLLGLPALLLLLTQETVALVIALILVALAAPILIIYALWRKTTIRIVRAGRAEDITGIFRPGRVRRVVTAMVERIRETQARGFAELAAQDAAAAQALTPPAPSPPPDPPVEPSPS